MHRLGGGGAGAGAQPKARLESKNGGGGNVYQLFALVVAFSTCAAAVSIVFMALATMAVV